MPLIMIYSLITSVLRPDALVDISSNAERFHGLFVALNGNDKFLSYSRIVFTAQNGYTDKDLMELDYLSSSLGIPIFSKKFVDLVGEILSEDASFYKCIVRNKENEYDYFVCNIEKKESLVDIDNSEYRILTDGRKVIKKPVFIRRQKDDFFIARDEIFTHLYAVSEKFISLINNYNLLVSYKEL